MRTRSTSYSAKAAATASDANVNIPTSESHISSPLHCSQRTTKKRKTTTTKSVISTKATAGRAMTTAVASTSTNAASTFTDFTDSTPTIDTKPVEQKRVYQKGRKIAYGFILTHESVTRRAKTLPDKNGRRLWNKFNCLDVEMYCLRRILASADMDGARVDLIEREDVDSAWAIYWRSNYDIICVPPPPEIEKAGVPKLQDLLGITMRPGWFYVARDAPRK
ncbi:hypothetical protein ABKN59_002247 [Abortiporus biennis]